MILEHHLTLEEIKKVLHLFPKYKAPGEDGFTRCFTKDSPRIFMNFFLRFCNKICLTFIMKLFKKEPSQFFEKEE